MLQQMISLLALIIFTPSQIIVASNIQSANECVNFTILSEESRSRFFSNNLTPFNDSSLRGWFAFNGSAGRHIATSCVTPKHCGTSAPGWMPGGHPNANEGAVTRSACFSHAQLCCFKSAKMLVRNCSGFYVYKMDMIPYISVGFRLCGAGIEGLPPVDVAENKNTSDNTTDECLVYNTLDERDRAADYFSYHTMKCDANLPQAWYRFTDSAGTVMPTQCVPKLHCGTISPGWLNGKHPTVGEGVVERMVCFTKDDDCCYWYSNVRVRNCSDFIVYRFGQFPALQHNFCGLRYCGAGKIGCRDRDGNIYEVQQTWNPNPLVTCTCAPGFTVQCKHTKYGCWDSYGNAFVNGQEWLSNSITKCVCRNQKIICAKLSRPACIDEKNIIREHGINWSPGSCFNCSCADGAISCIKYHVTIEYGLFRMTTVGTCMPCRRPSFDIKPAGQGTESDCKVFFQLKKANELFHCSNGAFIRKDHVCNGITECSDGSDEARCDDVICRDEAGQVLILKKIWKVTKCLQCKCSAGLLKCERRLQVNFPGMLDAYVPLKESCEQPSCNTVDFIRDRRHACEAIETTEGGRILLEGETWDYQGCKLYFGGQKSQRYTGCPKPIGPLCYMYNGAVCCGKKCPALVELASKMRGSLTVCTGGLQLAASDDVCNLPREICLPASDDCKTDFTCQDEKANTYFEGATWSVGDCISCECKKGLITCSQRMTFITSNGEITQNCSQPQCNVAAFGESNKGICKACSWKNQTLLDGYRWTENGVDFFCASGQRVRPGCYLYAKTIKCTGAFRGIQNLMLISPDEQLFLCESGDEIRSLNDRCNKIGHECHDDSDEKDCVQYFCPSHTWFNLKWNRTAVDTVVLRSCSEVDTNLGGHFSSRCTSRFLTTWKHKESCDCEKKTILQQLRMKLSSVNRTNLVELTRELRSKAINFTNKGLFFSYLKNLFKTGARILSPVSQQNDMEALNFSKILFNTFGDNHIFQPSLDSFCPQGVSFLERHSLQEDVKEFSCQAPNLTRTLTFCKQSIVPPMRAGASGEMGPSRPWSAPKPMPGISRFWVSRTVLNLKIDSSQLSPGYDARDSSSLVPKNHANHANHTSLVNGSGVSSRLVNANCSWVEYDLNGSIKIKATQINDEEEERKALIQTYLELALSSISIFAAIISLIILSCLRIRNSERIFVHKNLLLSLCLVYIVMIFDTFVFTKRKQKPKLCSSMAVIQHFTHIAIFSWMLVEGIHLYIKLVKVFSVRKLYITYIIIGWGLPVVIVGLIGAIRPLTYDMSKTYYKNVTCGTRTFTAEIVRERCWLHDGEWLYKGPILAILLVNVVIFVVLLRVIFTKISIKYQTDNVQKAKRGMKSVAALLPLLGVTWLLGFVAAFSQVILYLFIILNSLQGLLFCIFHSLLDDQINEILTKSLRKWRMTFSGRNDGSSRSRITSTTTNLTLTDSCQGSLSGKEHGKQRQSIQEIAEKPDETEL